MTRSVCCGCSAWTHSRTHKHTYASHVILLRVLICWGRVVRLPIAASLLAYADECVGSFCSQSRVAVQPLSGAKCDDVVPHHRLRSAEHPQVDGTYVAVNMAALLWPPPVNRTLGNKSHSLIVLPAIPFPVATQDNEHGTHFVIATAIPSQVPAHLVAHAALEANGKHSELHDDHTHAHD